MQVAHTRALAILGQPVNGDARECPAVARPAKRGILHDFGPGQISSPKRTTQTPLTRAIFSPDGKLVMTCGGKRLKLWDSDTQNQVGQIEDSSNILWADINPAGSHLVTASSSGQVSVWNVESKGPPLKNLSCNSEARFARFTPDGIAIIAVDASDKLTAWRFSDGETLAKDIPHDLSVKEMFPSLPQFTRQGSRLVAYHNLQLEVWDTIAWKRLSTRELGDRALNVAFSERGDRAVLSNGSAEARIFNIPEPFPENI